MSGLKQQDFFEKPKISDRKEPLPEKVSPGSDEIDEASRLSQIAGEEVPTASERERIKKEKEGTVNRRLDKFYRDVGARPKNPQEELFSEE